MSEHSFLRVPSLVVASHPHVLHADLDHPVPQTIILPCRLLQMREVRQPGDGRHEPAATLGWIADMRELFLQLQRVQVADPGRGDHDGRRLVSRALLQMQSMQKPD